MKIDKKTLAALIICGILLICAFALTGYELFFRPAAEPEPLPEEDPTVVIELAAVGDNLMHMPLINSGRTDEGYDFTGLYENISPHIAGLDLKIINQETVFVDDPSRYSGYPTFGGPTAVGDALVAAGFNVIQQASNHSYDKGESGLADTLGYWRSRPVTLLGVNSDANDALRVDKFTKDGFTVALMNYTYGLNGFVLPSGKEYLVNMLDEDDRPAIAGQIARARAESDMVIMLPHWGTEYSAVPDDYQRDWLKFFNENGVDIVIGAHPHVLQTCEEYVGESGHRTVVFYSLGNFISNQDTIVNELGGMARITLIKDKDGARVADYSLEPCFTHVANGKYTVYMLTDYTDELARRHAKYGGSLTTAAIWNKYYDITGFAEGKTKPELTVPAA